MHGTQAFAASATCGEPLRLDRLACDRPVEVWRLDPAGAGQPPERARQLTDIGFVPGERVVVLGRSWPGAGAMVVLIGQSRFALRRDEAACVVVRDSGDCGDIDPGNDPGDDGGDDSGDDSGGRIGRGID